MSFHYLMFMSIVQWHTCPEASFHFLKFWREPGLLTAGGSHWAFCSLYTVSHQKSCPSYSLSHSYCTFHFPAFLIALVLLILMECQYI
jgi:hypothetical protein